jgi:polyhydroxyalkanoate synthesis regulator phasin
MIKELMMTGLGAAAILKDKVEEEVKRLEETGKLKTDDAKNFLKSLEEKGKEEEQRAHDQVKKMMKDIIDELGLATKEDLQKLKEELK